MTMTSDTPRTDANIFTFSELAQAVSINFARQLERELIQALRGKYDVEFQLSAANAKLLEQAAVIAQMREALKRYYETAREHTFGCHPCTTTEYEVARVLALDSNSSALSSHVKQKQREVLEEFAGIVQHHNEPGFISTKNLVKEIRRMIAELDQKEAGLGTQETTGTAK